MIQNMATAELCDFEELAFTPPDTYEKRAIAELLRRIVILKHTLDDPRFQYAGGRATREAIVVRNCETIHLRKQIKEKDALLAAVSKAVDDIPHPPVGTMLQSDLAKWAEELSQTLKGIPRG